ncbi:MAG: hypothetical protein ABI557_20920, partial [Aureliella sp.]
PSEKWPDQIDATYDIERPSKEWAGYTSFAYLGSLVAKLPAAAVPALARELENGSDDKYFLPLLLSRIPEHDLAQKLDSSEPFGTPWLEYSQTLSGREQLANLRRVMQAALARINLKPNDSDEQTALTLVSKIVGITKLLGEPLKEQEVSAMTIREYVQSASRQPLQINDNAVNSYLLKSFAEIEGIDQVPLEAILHLAWSNDQLDDELEKMIRSLYRAHPDEFSRFFMAALQGNSGEPFVGLASLLRSNSPQNENAPKGVWHAIIESLTTEPATREAIDQLMNERLKSFKSFSSDDPIVKAVRSLLP